MKAQVQLQCGCVPYFTNPIPLLGDLLSCSVHGTSKRVLAEWHFKCTGCRYGRNVGDSPMTAEVKATTHAIRMHHLVRVWKVVGAEIFDDFVVPTRGSQIVIEFDAPPF